MIIIKKEKLYWISKRLLDVVDGIMKLSEEEKCFVIKRAEKMNPYSLIDLYNSLGEYGEL